jgi:hypothetical protein
MKLTKRMISLFVMLALLFSLAVPAFAEEEIQTEEKDLKSHPVFTNGKTQGPPAFIQEKLMLKGFTFIDGQRIKVKNKHVKFDVPPVIKGGRTLIPVRAITEAMGAEVEWDAEKYIVTITKDETVIKFYLIEGIVKVNGNEVEIDAPPGLINNRTFVPLRFIAETFGLRVGYDEKTGKIDIDEKEEEDENKPLISPTSAEFDKSDPEDIEVTVTWNNYTLEAVKNKNSTLNKPDDYSVEGDTITIKKEYLLDMEDDEAELKFIFKSAEDKLEDAELKITIK